MLCARMNPVRPVRFFTRVGVRRRAYFGAGGQVLLAWQPKEALEQALPQDRLEAFTLWSITDPADYLRRLRQVREQRLRGPQHPRVQLRIAGSAPGFLGVLDLVPKEILELRLGRSGHELLDRLIARFRQDLPDRLTRFAENPTT